LEDIMKIGTKLAILLVAAMLSLAGVNAIAGALSVAKIAAAATPSTEVIVTLRG
jgi:hypothetical protein